MNALSPRVGDSYPEWRAAVRSWDAAGAQDIEAGWLSGVPVLEALFPDRRIAYGVFRRDGSLTVTALLPLGGGDGSGVDVPDLGPCWTCGKERNGKHGDGCLAWFPGVLQACCGHGKESPYVSLCDGGTLRGGEAIAWFREQGIEVPALSVGTFCEISLDGIRVGSVDNHPFVH